MSQFHWGSSNKFLGFFVCAHYKYFMFCIFITVDIKTINEHMDLWNNHGIKPI